MRIVGNMRALWVSLVHTQGQLRRNPLGVLMGMVCLEHTAAKQLWLGHLLGVRLSTNHLFKFGSG